MKSRTIIQAIRKYKSFLITTHVNPDIDGLSCELALGLYLRSLKKKARIVNTGRLPKMYQFLPGSKGIERFNRQNIHYDAVIVLDCSDLDRIDNVKRLIKGNKPIINIDHHITNDYFGHFNLVKPKVSSTAEVIFDLLKEAGCSLSRPMAQLLYLGIMTDTGSFRYDNTTAHTHAVVSQLLKFNMDINEMYKNIYENISRNDFETFIALVSRFEMKKGGRIALIELSQKTLKDFSGDFDIKEKIFSFLRSIRGVEVIVIFTENKKNLTRVNFRSQGKIDVAEFASYFGGGGHKKASGCKMETNIKTTKRQVLRQLERIFN